LADELKWELEVNSTCININNDQTQKSVGKLLKQARQQHKVRDLTLIASELCIKPYLLEALEQDNFESFAAACYATGFLKSYASYLGLNTKEIISIYVNEYAVSKELAVLKFPEAEKHFQLPLKSVAGIAILCLATFVGVWNSNNNLDAGEVAIPSVSSDVNPVIDTVKEVEDFKTPAIKDILAAPIDEFSSTKAINLADVHLKANDDVWIRISENDGTALIDKILTKGENIVVTKSQGLSLMTNNAAALDVFVGSKAFKPLGAEGEIVKNFNLAHEKLRELSMRD
jgi:cytoskeleton protein RodZ